MINQNQQTVEPSLKDLLDLFRKDLLISLNCHHIGTIQEFDAVRQVAKVTINYKRTRYRPLDKNPVSRNNLDKSQVVYGPDYQDYPVLIDAPVVVLGGGSGCLTFPIAKGDECLVMFNDRNIDAWFSGDSSSPVKTPRLHAFADALVLVGIRSLPNAVQSYSTSEPQLRSKDGAGKFTIRSSAAAMVWGDNAEVSVGGGKVTAKNTTTTLGTQLQQLMTQLETLTSSLAGYAPFGGGLQATITAVNAQLTLIKTSLGNLLT